MSQIRILSLGEVLWDLFPDGEQFGGAPANFACHAAIHGAEVTMGSAVGDDERGHKAIKRLCEHGVDVSLIQTTPGIATGTVRIELDDTGKPTFSIENDVAWDQLSWNQELSDHSLTADAVYFGTLGQRSLCSRNTIRHALENAISASVPRVLDVNLRPPFFDKQLIRDSIHLASILKLSDEELGEVCGACDVKLNGNPSEALRALAIQYKLDVVVMTKGAEGATLVTVDEVLHQPGIATNVIDTVGAGDSFAASFLIGELEGRDRTGNLHNACRIAAATCSHPGAIPPKIQTANGPKQ